MSVNVTVYLFWKFRFCLYCVFLNYEKIRLLSFLFVAKFANILFKISAYLISYFIINNGPTFLVILNFIRCAAICEVVVYLMYVVLLSFQIYLYNTVSQPLHNICLTKEFILSRLSNFHVCVRVYRACTWMCVCLCVCMCEYILAQNAFQKTNKK